MVGTSPISDSAAALIVDGAKPQDTGQSAEQVFEDSLHDHWYTADEARDYGFIDGIVGSLADVFPRRRARAGLGEAR